MNYQELIEQLRYESGPVARDEAADTIESLLAENERWKAELAKYRDAPVVAWEITFQSPDTPTAVADYLQIDPNATVEPLIVKPGEEK